MEIYKEIKLDRPFPSAESLVYDEISTLLETAEVQYSAFRDNFTVTSKQEAVFRHYYSAPDELQIYLLYGGTGSGKTICALALITDILLRNPGAIGMTVRKTYTEIEDSLLPDIMKFFDTYSIDYNKREKNAPNLFLPNGSMIRMRSEIKSSRSKQEKADSLGSTQFSVAYLNEADSMSEGYFATLVSRMRQRSVVKRPVILIDCNPPPEDHWIYKTFFVHNDPNNPKSNVKVFHFPVDTNTHLDPQYIVDLKKFYSNYPSLYKKFVEGRFGPSVKGEPIFKEVFATHIHVAKEPLTFDPSLPLQRGWDFGFRRPACVILQDDPEKNEIRVLRATLGSHVLIGTFAERIQRVCDKHYPGAVWHDYCDPAGSQRDSRSGKTDIDILKDMGIHPRSERTAIQYGLDIIRQCLMKNSEKHTPILQIDPEGASLLVEAMGYGYTHNPDAPNDSKIHPMKDDYYDHIVDAFRYIMIHVRKSMGRSTGSKNKDLWIPINQKIDSSGRIKSRELEVLYGKPKKKGGYNFGSSGKKASFIVR